MPADPDAIETELQATDGYEFDGGVELAIRRVRALRAAMRLPESFNRRNEGATFDRKYLADQLQQALAYVAANQTQTDAQRLANPSVLHTDFSTFRGYGPSAAEGCQ